MTKPVRRAHSVAELFVVALLVGSSCASEAGDPAPQAWRQAEDVLDALFFGADDLVDATALVLGWRDAPKDDALSQHLWQLLAERSRALVAGLGQRRSGPPDGRLLYDAAAALNATLTEPGLLQMVPAEVAERARASSIAWDNGDPRRGLARINRNLLCTTYGNNLRPPGDVRYRGQRQHGWQCCWVFERGSSHAELDTETGRPALVLYPFKPSPEGALDVQQAQQAAAEWLARHRVDVSGWVTSPPRRAQTPSDASYQCGWERRTPDGVRLPSLVRVWVGGDGEVRAVLHVERPLAVSTDAKLDRALAVHLAAAAARLPPDTVAAADLRVWFSAAGAQRLYWYVLLRPVGLDTVAATVDDETGTVVLARE